MANNGDWFGKATKGLERILPHFGTYKTIRPNFKANNTKCENFDYAGIELITDSIIADNLKEHINTELNKENGIYAHIRFLEWGTEKNGKYKYVAEIIPNKNVKPTDYETVTKDYFKRLPKVIKNFTMKNCPEKRRDMKQSL